MYNTSAGTNFDGLSIPSLLPNKYTNVKLIEVKQGKSTKKDGAEGKNIITFLFQTEDGQQHQHTEWDIDASDAKAADKAKNMTIRIGHILSKFLPKDRLVSNANSFLDYSNWVMSMINSVDYKNVPVDILVTGNVYQKKATSAFTGFPPFIAKHGEPLNFSNNQLLDNQKYYAFKQGQSNPQADNDNSSAQQGSFGAGTATDEVKADF